MNIITIPKKVNEKPNVGAYVRVSTDSAAQEDSFAMQSKYWNNKFAYDKTVNFVGLFTDEGISGKTMRNRKGLNAMLDKVRNGEIDKVYTKSISRFARNYTETMTVIRELRDIGVPVIFEKEGINTLDPKCGLMLTVFSSLAEEELRSMSLNQKWAKRKKFANGGVEYGQIYGYDLIDGKLIINPIEAIGVKRIFELYLKGYGTVKIAQILDNEGFKTKTGGDRWSCVTVRNILINEKYIGDSLLQKSIYDLKTRVKNRGELPQYYVESTHEAIITKEDYEAVQIRLAEQQKKFAPNNPTNNRGPLSGKIKCGNCGAGYCHKIYAKGKTYENVKWMCRIKNDKTVAVCDNHEVKEEVLFKLLTEAYNECLDEIGEHGEVMMQEQKLMQMLATESELKRLHAKGYISDADYINRQANLLEQVHRQEQLVKTAKLNNSALKKYQKSAIYTDDMADFLICATVNKNWSITFKFMNGKEITKTYTNGRAGNVNGKLCKYKA